MEEELYQISDEFGNKAFPIDWNKLPNKLIEKLNSDDFCNIMSYSKKDNKLTFKTVVYFRKVKKFRKNITEIKNDNIIFGV